MRNFSYLLSLLALASIFSSESAYAQTLSPALPQPVQYLVSPEAPGPGDTVYLEVQGVGSFIGNSKITWQQDGKVVLSGVGERTFSVKMGALGSATVVNVRVDSAQYGTMAHNFNLSPSLVNLLWEAQTTVPPFYRGKALYSGGALITVAAFPQIVSRKLFVASKTLSFQWSLNGNLIPEQSGLGRSTFTFQGDQLKTQETVEVDVLLGNNKVGYGRVVVPATSPQVLFYQRDPLRGEILEAAFPSTVTLADKELTVAAEPYYFSRSSTVLQNANVTYDWSINGTTATGPDSSKGVLTLRRTSDGAGMATLEVSVQNTSSDQLVQAANATLQVLFGQNPGTSAFGI